MRISPKKWVLPALIAAVFIVLIAAFLAMGVLTILAKRRSTEALPITTPGGWADPVSLINVNRVAPATGLLRLAGKDDITAINSALKEGDVESAYSLLVLSPNLSDEERIGSLILIARHYAANGDVSGVQNVVRQVNLIAVLSPTLSDLARADALLQAGEQLQALKLTNEALGTFNQARTIALHSVYLRPAHRKHILDRLIPAYSALGLGREAWEELEVALEAGTFAQKSDVEVVPPVLSELRLKDYSHPEVQAAVADREKQATVLAEYIRDRGGKVSQSLVDSVVRALLVEDARRQGVYQAELLRAPQLVDKIALMHDRVNWLTLKYAVALRAQGLSLMPAWEKQVGAIQSELAKARQDLYALYGDWIVTLPEASKVNRAWLELFRLELQMGRLGLYPNYPEEQLIVKMKEATRTLIAEGVDQSMRVDTVSKGEFATFVLVDGASYGSTTPLR